MLNFMWFFFLGGTVAGHLYICISAKLKQKLDFDEKLTA